MNCPNAISKTIQAIRKHLSPLPRPSVHPDTQPDPFRILIATLISLRTKDSVTETASARLFSLASTPEKMAKLEPEAIEHAIYPAGFYKNKASQIIRISKILMDVHDGEVPRDRTALLELPGVGIKTANLTLSLGYGLAYICVDTHVHRIANRLGWISTRTPEETEQALMDVLEKKWWIGINHILVIFGQRICRPVSPLCTTCPVADTCPRNGVTSSR